MVSTVNTYGLRSINTHTFNGSCCSSNYYPDDPPSWRQPWFISADVRNCINTLLRINNLLFNVLGYFPETKRISGVIRMGIGCSIVVVTLAIETLPGGLHPIIGHWYVEGLATGVAQISRGSMEALTPYGSIVNACLDILGTVSNIWAERHFDPSEHPRHHPDPSYWLPFQLLRLV